MTDDLEVTYERLKRSLQGRVDDLEDAAWLMHNLDHVLEAQQQTDERLEKVEAERDSLNSTVAYLQGFWVPERVQELIAERDSLRERCFRTEEISASWAGTAGRMERERDSLRAALERIETEAGDNAQLVGDRACIAIHAIARQALTSSEKEKVTDAEA